MKPLPRELSSLIAIVSLNRFVEKARRPWICTTARAVWRSRAGTTELSKRYKSYSRCWSSRRKRRWALKYCARDWMICQSPRLVTTNIRAMLNDIV